MRKRRSRQSPPSSQPQRRQNPLCQRRQKRRAQRRPNPLRNPLPVTGDALNAYLRALAEAQAARADALQAQNEALRAQQALQQAIERAQQAQGALSALVSAAAKESAAPDGWRLGLDGKWAPPAEAQATQ
jgi:hypothetical protein